MPTSTRSSVRSAPPDADASTTDPGATRDFVPVRADVIRAELAALGIDEVELALLSANLPPAVVRAILAEGRATKASLRRLRSGLRWAWISKSHHVPGEDAFHFRRLTLKYLSEGVAE